MSKNLYIVPYDFTPVTAKALDYALMLAEKVNTEIQLLHLAESREKGMAKKKQLEDFAKTITPPAGSEVTALVKIGNIFTDIGRIAKEQHAQLIIMGTHGIKGLQNLFGSNAMKVITSAECPFIVIQKDTDIQAISKVVVPIDLTKESLQIVNYAGDIANMFGAEVHVIAEKQTDTLLHTKLMNRVSIVKKQYEDRDIEPIIDYVKKSGAYDKKVLQYANEKKANFIALSYHSESLLPQFDSFAPNLITNKYKFPVMIINSKLASALYF